jgi:hypothetical protein
LTVYAKSPGLAMLSFDRLGCAVVDRVLRRNCELESG